ncbi:MAG: thioredoxin family protein [Chitinophagaceae bacterium]|nr:thioredoxin family protein [Chitinophagaceae bacterium]
MKFSSRWMQGAALTLLLLILSQSNIFAQGKEPVSFTFDTEHIDDSTVYLNIRAKIAPGIKLFAMKNSEDDLVYSTLQFVDGVKDKIKGNPVFTGNIQKETDPDLESTVEYFTDSVTWHQPIKAARADSFLVVGSLSYMYKEGDDFPSKEEKFEEFVLPATHKDETALNPTDEVTTTVGNVSRLSTFKIFLLGFLGGLIALITPCVYSMIPITVSFFTKSSANQKQGIKNAVSYALSIIFIFTLLGFLITVIFGPDALNVLSTNWIANLIFFAIFLIFGISFLGAFEITLPSSIANKADSKSGTSSYMGIFFMALTLVVVSFSCTGPIIGNLLVLAARGSYFGPLMGMFGFSLALGLPFALFAFFPSKLNMLGKSGGWLNAVKVTLGFLELALALKFLSNADLAMGWRILDREVFIVLWVVIFILLGFYLLGKLKFHHDDELPKNDFGLPYISITRLFLSIISFAFALYMIPGLWGAPLKKISAFVPPMGTQDFNMAVASAASHGNTVSLSGEDALPAPKKYADRMKMYEPAVVVKHHMTTYFDYKEALEVARKLHKPLMIDFTGINCVNCRDMEGKVWIDDEVMKRLKNDFVIASLYVDVHSVYIPKEEQYYSEALKKTVKTLGEMNADLQISTFNANVQPYYFFLDGNEQRLIPEGYGHDTSVEKFIKLLDEAKKNYEASRS